MLSSPVIIGTSLIEVQLARKNEPSWPACDRHPTLRETRLVVGIEPEGVAISPDRRWVYVTAETSNTVSVIDTARRTVAASFLVDPRPRSAALSPDCRWAYVTRPEQG